ncbi:MAG: endonuclease III, partial [Desulfamplus sp.]|nr:endonuclease III [Desulfamplus sp.]
MEINISIFLEKLREEIASYKVPVVELVAVQTRDPFKVLVATILSARTKDETTAKASERLFKAAPDYQALERLTQNEIAQLIYPVGFYKAKAGYLAKLPEALKRFGGEVPQDLDELLTLPGVGRKTASLVLNVAFQKDAICVDTHVHRIMNIWGYVQTKTPLDTEMALRKKLPLHHWQEVNTILVTFGQGTCRPVSPHCDRCVISNLCPRKGIKP